MKLYFRRKINIILNSIGLVYGHKKNILWTIVISFLVFQMFVILNYFTNLLSVLRATNSYYLTIRSLIAQSLGLAFATSLLNFLAIILVSVLSGMVIIMFIYKFKLTRNMQHKGGVSGILGVFSGALAASCPACSIALISLLGVSGGLAVLPFNGLEFSFLAVILLVFSLYMISKSLVDCEECRLSLSR